MALGEGIAGIGARGDSGFDPRDGGIDPFDRRGRCWPVDRRWRIGNCI